MTTLPSLQQLYTSVKTNLETKLGLTISIIGKVFLNALAGTQAGKLKLFYLALGILQKNIFVDTAQSESIGGTLERFGRVKLGRNPLPAVAGKYELTVTGSIGGIIKASTTFKSDDTSLSPGFLFILDSAYTLTGTTGLITVRALTPGIESKLNVLDTLTATQPIALVNSSCYVSTEIVAPIAAEDLEDYRAKALLSYRLEPQGGAATDYRLWAQDAQGVERVYPYTRNGTDASEIDLFIEATLADSTDGKGTPSAQLLLDVEDVIQFNPDTTLPLLERGRKPLSVFLVHYLPITLVNVDIVIPGYLNLTPSIQAQLNTALKAAVDAIRPFVAAADIITNKNDVIDVNKIIGVIITQTPGATFGTPILKINNVAVSSYQFVYGNIPYYNSLSFT